MKNQLIPVVSLFTLLIIGCEGINPGIDYPSEYDNLPAITFFNPGSAECGTEITIYGQNFGIFESDNFVTFDSWGSEAHSGRIAEVTKVLQPGVMMVRIPMHLVPGDYTISLQASGHTHRSDMTFKIEGN